MSQAYRNNEEMPEWYREYLRESNRAYYEKNQETLRERGRRYYHEHKAQFAKRRAEPAYLAALRQKYHQETYNCFPEHLCVRCWDAKIEAEEKNRLKLKYQRDYAKVKANAKKTNSNLNEKAT